MAIIDSGADTSVITEEIARCLGISTDGQMARSYGVGGLVTSVDASMDVHVSIGNYSRNIHIPVKVILGEHSFPVLLGREGFFDAFRVLFDQVNRRIELFPN
mgnify:FL=1